MTRILDVGDEHVESRRAKPLQDGQKIIVQALITAQMLRIGAPVKRAGGAGIE